MLHLQAPAMRDHQWAANQLWQRLIAPADQRWYAGADALSTAPLGLVAPHEIPGSTGLTCQPST
jgi:hypothetical protein